MAGIEQHEAEPLADAGHGLQPRLGVGVMVPGGFDDGEGDGAPQRSVVGDERQSNCDTLLYGWSGKALGTPRAVRLVGDLFANGRQVLRAVGMLHVREDLGPLVRQRYAAPTQDTSGPHVGGRDIGLREHTATQEGGHLWRLHLVIFGLTAMDGLHAEGMTEAFVGLQCGFASGEAGNPLTPEQQAAQLHLVAQVARRVW